MQALLHNKLGGWKSLTQNLHEFERIRAIWENILESFKIIFQIIFQHRGITRGYFCLEVGNGINFFGFP